MRSETRSSWSIYNFLLSQLAVTIKSVMTLQCKLHAVFVAVTGCPDWLKLLTNQKVGVATHSTHPSMSRDLHTPWNERPRKSFSSQLNNSSCSYSQCCNFLPQYMDCRMQFCISKTSVLKLCTLSQLSLYHSNFCTSP